ncbi:MAG: FAD-binding protein [Cryomorphaceae bacterium]|nr:FAD-binding protein [Cryomorphaceae bacterium]
MIKDVDIVIAPNLGDNMQEVIRLATQKCGWKISDVQRAEVIKRSVDARGKYARLQLRVRISDAEENLYPLTDFFWQNVSNSPEVLIIGFGPAGMFAAMELIQHGFKPVVFERGSDVRKRRRDLKAINRDHTVNPESNYCFGEGGAGTYSDGKLYTRSHKRGNISRILDNFVYHGAHPDIRVDAHPHIGTNKLPKVVENIRETIIQAGGEIHFDTRVDEIFTENGKLTGLRTATGERYRGNAAILATGHSARDVFHLLYRSGINIENKPFALGVRIEHPQEIINKVQYSCDYNNPHLPPASYALSTQVQGRGVFSFCMCPGGFIVPASTAPGEVVVNGMSPSRRDGKFANSGFVVSVEPEDWKSYGEHGPLAAMAFQAEIEKKAWEAGGKTMAAPAQRMIDFVSGKNSTDLNETSYIPGLTSANLSEVLPGFISQRIREACLHFKKKMPSYYTNEANLVGVESRTSSPVRIPRNPQTLSHPEVEGLLPCGEGAGYAGGIVSAAMDGERCARAAITIKKAAD